MYLLTYNFNATTVDDLQKILHTLQEQFPQETFFVLPDTMSLMQFDKEQLTSMKNFIDILLKNKEGES